jgi:hypothetical protein
MRDRLRKTIVGLVAGLVAALALLGPVEANPDRYVFELLKAEVRQGSGVVIPVRLLDKETGKTVPDAVIFAMRVDMSPDDMASMVEKVELLPPQEPGLYRFRTSLTMPGRWRLSLAAKVQGAEGTVRAELIVSALP